MMQTQTYSDVLNMAFMLPLREQKQLIKDMQANVKHPRIIALNDQSHCTWDELRAGVREAEGQIARGEIYSSEEDDRLFDEFIADELGVFNKIGISY
jgi:hypothetical protein